MTDGQTSFQFMDIDVSVIQQSAKDDSLLRSHEVDLMDDSQLVKLNDMDREEDTYSLEFKTRESRMLTFINARTSQSELGVKR